MTDRRYIDEPGYFDDWSVPDARKGPYWRAYRRGREACRNGVPRSANPYFDHRTARGSITFSRSYRRNWWKGWDHENIGKEIT